MRRHRFDPVALVFGAVFVAAGLIVLAGGELIEEGRALIPAGLIALGVALLVHVGRRGRPPAPAGPVAPPRIADDRDVDALFAPVDDALADWERTHAATDATAVDPTRVDTTESTDIQTADADPADANIADADVTEVVDPTLRYPRPEAD
jgi:hypothetical protein